MSSTTRRELERPRKPPATVGLSGSESELALVVTKGGARGEGNTTPELRRDAARFIACEQKLMFDFLRLLCLSNVFCAEKGLGRTKYLIEKQTEINYC